MTKAYIAITVGQEINGKNVTIRVDKASFKQQDVDIFLKSNKNSWSDSLPLDPNNPTVTSVPFYFERHAMEIDIENE